MADTDPIMIPNTYGPHRHCLKLTQMPCNIVKNYLSTEKKFHNSSNMQLSEV